MYIMEIVYFTKMKIDGLEKNSGIILMLVNKMLII